MGRSHLGGLGGEVGGTSEGTRGTEHKGPEPGVSKLTWLGPLDTIRMQKRGDKGLAGEQRSAVYRDCANAVPEQWFSKCFLSSVHLRGREMHSWGWTAVSV